MSTLYGPLVTLILTVAHVMTSRECRKGFGHRVSEWIRSGWLSWISTTGFRAGCPPDIPHNLLKCFSGLSKKGVLDLGNLCIVCSENMQAKVWITCKR